MLHHLRVRNLGILEDAAIAPGPGFTVITGETGAGKTMLLGALRLLGGEKANPASVGPFGAEAIAECLLGDGDDEVGVNRVIPREGKSRAYVDGNVVAASALREKLGALVEIIGQHDRLPLRAPQAIMGMIDSGLDDEGREARARYLETWARYRNALADQRRLGGDAMALERELDLVRYQADEIAAAGLRTGDDQRMQAMAFRLRNAEVIRQSLLAASQELDGITSGAGAVLSELRKGAEIDPAFTEMSELAEELDIRTRDLHRMTREMAESVTEDPRALEELEERLNLVGDLKRKYGRTVEEILEFGHDASLRVSELESLLAHASTIGHMVAGLETVLTRDGKSLMEARRRAADRIEVQTKTHLAELGLPSALLGVDIEDHAPGPSGADRVTIAFASDDRLVPGPIHEVASGGELSRLMLALRLATRDPGAGTIVFDEIDAGVGGATALALGRKIADLAGGTQVLCVTHLPQVAAHATTHYVVEREGARAAVRRVEGEDRLTELSRMLAGLPHSERGRDAAAELLEGAHRG